MDTLEQATERFELLGFHKQPVITADANAKRLMVQTGDAKPFARSIKVLDDPEFWKTHCSEKRDRRDCSKDYSIVGTFDQSDGTYRLQLTNAVPSFDFCYLDVAADTFKEYLRVCKDIERMASDFLIKVRGKLEIPEDVEIDFGGGRLQFTPKIRVRGKNLDEIYDKFIKSLKKFGYEI